MIDIRRYFIIPGFCAVNTLMCDVDLASLFNSLVLKDKDHPKMNTQELTAIVTAAVSAALSSQKEEFDKKLNEIAKRFTSTSIANVESFEEVRILGTVRCEETLDLVKSLPEFDGRQETYVSWRQAAHTAYKLYEPYDGSAKHYQAVAIIRNKIRGAADAVLASFNTVLNFKAIVARLDFTYADKRPIYLIEQELSTLRQGNLTVLNFYDEVERKLTLLTNKTIMTYESHIANSINDKYRLDALRVFVSGLRKPLCDILFSTRPTDLPSALALAQEVEANHERYMFASNYSKHLEDKDRGHFLVKRIDENKSKQIESRSGHKNPYFQNRQEKRNLSSNNRDQGTEPMDIDPSTSGFRRSTKFEHYNPTRNFLQQNKSQNMHVSNNRQIPFNSGNQGQQIKRPPVSDRSTGPKVQRIHHISDTSEDVATKTTYDSIVEREIEDIEEINFLERVPSSLGSNEQ